MKRAGREYKLIYSDETGQHDSITITGSTWFDHKAQEGGGAVKFMQRFYERKLGFTDETYTRAVDAGTYTNFANDRAGYGLA